MKTLQFITSEYVLHALESDYKSITHISTNEYTKRHSNLTELFHWLVLFTINSIRNMYHNKKVKGWLMSKVSC